VTAVEQPVAAGRTGSTFTVTNRTILPMCTLTETINPQSSGWRRFRSQEIWGLAPRS
jgi:hypothetical protein